MCVNFRRSRKHRREYREYNEMIKRERFRKSLSTWKRWLDSPPNQIVWQRDYPDLGRATPCMTAFPDLFDDLRTEGIRGRPGCVT